MSFERGTSLIHGDRRTVFVSGAASIDNKGEVAYPGDVVRQAGRLLENIGALLSEGGATMKDMGYFIVYLRDMSDYELTEKFMRTAYPATPHHHCRQKFAAPEWLVEMEGEAEIIEN